MSIKHSMFFTTLIINPWARGILLTLYYLAILLGLILMYGKGDFSTPPFIYQGF
jgi:D-Ala-teichoic acid biosynthesis protein.